MAWKERYEKLVEEARLHLHLRILGAVGAITKAYVDMLVEIETAFPDVEKLTKKQAGVLSLRIIAIIAEYSRLTQVIVRRGSSMAVSTAVDAHVRGATEAIAEAGVSIALAGLAGVKSNVTKYAQSRRGSFSGNEGGLIEGWTDLGAKEINHYIRKNIGRPSREASDQLLRQVSQHPHVEKALRNLGARGEAVRRGITRAGRAKDDIATPGRGMYTNAKRTLIHEMNSMYHEADALASHESPMVDLLQWHVSAQHATMGHAPDVCDGLKELNLHGFGPGIYYPATVPSLPHPHCQDYVTRIMRPPENWGDPKRTPVIPRVPGAEEVRKAMEAVNTRPGAKPVSKIKTDNIRIQVEQATQIAHDAYVDFNG